MDKGWKSVIFGISFFLLIVIGGFTGIIGFIFLGFVSLAIAWYYGSSYNIDIMKKANENFNKTLRVNNFIQDKKRISHDKLNGIAISENQKMIGYLTRNKIDDDFTFKSFHFNEIIEAKVITNHETLTSTSIGSSVTKGVIGGLVAGGVGSLIGGLSASKISSKQIKELTLEFVVNDILNPRYTITFYKKESPLKESSPIIQEVEEWYRIFSVIINRNNQKARSV